MKRGKQGKDKFKSRIASINLQELKSVSFFGEGDEKWSAAEEMVLLLSVENYNCGNWPLIAKIMSETFKRKFTADEVQDHYIQTYLEGDYAEAMNSGSSKLSNPSMLMDHTSKEDADWLQSADLNAYENVSEAFLLKLGYMPLREDFKMEYDPTAEDLIKHLDFEPTDEDPVSEEFNKNMKLILLDTYLNRLMERIEKKIAVKKFRVVEQFYAKSNPSSDKRFHGDKTMYSSPESVLSTPEIQYNNSRTPDANKLSLPSTKNRTRLKNSSVRKNLEKNFPCLTIDDYPGSELLTEDEKELCTDLGLMPVYYISYRLKLIWVDSERTAGRCYDDNLIPPHMTVAQCSQIVSFMEKAGLIKNENLLNIINLDD